MRYDYICNNCSNEDRWLIFETNHGMNEKPKVKCPKCGGINTEQTFRTVPLSYIRGYGWLDVKGRRRDLNLYTLRNRDPYEHMREAGEADDLAHRLKAGGKFNTNPKTFQISSGKKKLST